MDLRDIPIIERNALMRTGEWSDRISKDTVLWFSWMGQMLVERYW
jgi:hypothetical protein